MLSRRSVFADALPLPPDSRRLWLANTVTVVGAQLTVVAVPAQLSVDTGSSAYVGLTCVFGLLPLNERDPGDRQASPRRTVD